MKALVVIPARYGSTRFGGKVLANDTGRFLVEHTWLQARRARRIQQVLIATDSEQVRLACARFGAECVMTSESHQSGTDRIAEAVASIDVEIVVNVQADEPEIDPGHIDLLIDLLDRSPDAGMATLVTGFGTPAQVADPNVVKVVTDSAGNAIYFSRSVIPYDRATGGVGPVSVYLRHLGIYAYRKPFLMKYTALPQTPLEKLEKLEQLRVLESGHSIITGRVEHSCQGIDTPEQYQAFVRRYLKAQGAQS